MSDNIGSSVQELVIHGGAPLTSAVIGKLQDMDRERIGKDDSVVMRKAVLALLPIVERLEARVAELEARLAEF